MNTSKPELAPVGVCSLLGPIGGRVVVVVALVVLGGATDGGLSALIPARIVFSCGSSGV